MLNNILTFVGIIALISIGFIVGIPLLLIIVGYFALALVVTLLVDLFEIAIENIGVLIAIGLIVWFIGRA